MPDMVSIVIPAYNASNYLAEAIDSALKQTYKNYEIIVVNDGSADNGATREVALAYGDKIRYFEKENGGCASALNYGIQVMRGKWFSWLSHDDLYLPGKLEQLTGLIEQYHCDPDKTVLGCNDLILNARGKISHNIFNNSIGMLSPVQAFGETLNVKTINGCGLLIPKNILDEVGGFKTEYKHLLDRELWMRIAIAGYSYCYANEPLVISRVHAQQITIMAQSSLYNEETRLIDEYCALLNDSHDCEFLKQLCYFAYKRKHIKQGSAIKHRMYCNNGFSASVEARVVKFLLEGYAKRIVGSTYKRLVRK